MLRQARPPLIAVVRLRKGEWVLPKGKLDDGETARDAAMREVLEETGHDVSVHEFLGTLAYDAGGRAKIVHYWRMEAGGKPTRDLMHDVSAVDWLPLDAAIGRLSRDHERAFLANVGPLALEAARRSKEKKPIAAEKPRRRRPVTPKPAMPVQPPADDAVLAGPNVTTREAVEGDAVGHADIDQRVIEKCPPLLVDDAIDTAPAAEESESSCMSRSEAVGPDELAKDHRAIDVQALRISVMQRVRGWLRRVS